MNKIEKVFYLTTIILLLQITRNLSIGFYVFVLFTSYIYLYSIRIYIFFRNKNNIKFNILKFTFLLTLIWIPVISLANVNINDYLKSLPRYLITFPYILFCLTYEKFSLSCVRKILRLLCIFMGMVSLSVPYQIAFGPVSFFADYSYREGIVRYASLAGSLTALGTLGGFALAILLFTDDFLFSKRKKNILIVIIIAGMLMSLQKAAVANILVCFGMYILINGKVSILKKVSGVIGIFGVLYISYLIARETEFAIYVKSLIQYSFSGSSLGIKQDFIDRITELPKRVIIYNGLNIPDIFLGIGFPALGGTIGLPNYPMAHNNIFDLVFSGGIVHLISFIILMLSIPSRVLSKSIKKLKFNIIDRSYTVVILLILGNMLVGASSFYQPIIAVFTFFILSSYKRTSALVQEMTRVELEGKKKKN